VKTLIVENLQERLTSHGASLRPPAQREQLQQLLALSGSPNMSELVACLAIFDGFKDTEFDYRSEIRLWSSQEILGEVSRSYPSQGTIPFADFSGFSEVFGFHENGSHVIEAFSLRRVARSCLDFYDKLSRRCFDF
jgi:hypothetical protein